MGQMGLMGTMAVMRRIRAALAGWLLGAATAAAALPTVDFTSSGVGSQIGTTQHYNLTLNVQNNMTIANAGYVDYVSEIKIEGIYSAAAPSFTSTPNFWGVGTFGYTTIQLMDPARNLWRMVAGTSRTSARIASGSSGNFSINFTLPAGIPASAIRYGNVNAQGLTSTHGNQPYPTPDTFIGPIGVIYPAPEVGLTLAAGQARLGLGGLVVGREYRAMRSADLTVWEEAARFTVTEDPWPASGRVDREWREAAVVPGRRFYRLEWDEP